MESLAILTRSSIEEELRGLPQIWKVDGAQSAGITRERGALAGSVGAWLDFYGIVRDWEGGAEKETRLSIRSIDYEAHPKMAQHQLDRLLRETGEAHPVEAILLIHRIGEVPVGAPSLLVRILSPHRGEALRACADLIDELKKWVPIWKHPVPHDRPDAQ